MSFPYPPKWSLCQIWFFEPGIDPRIENSTTRGSTPRCLKRCHGDALSRFHAERMRCNTVQLYPRGGSSMSHALLGLVETLYICGVFFCFHQGDSRGRESCRTFVFLESGTRHPHLSSRGVPRGRRIAGVGLPPTKPPRKVGNPRNFFKWRRIVVRVAMFAFVCEYK